MNPGILKETLREPEFAMQQPHWLPANCLSIPQAFGLGHEIPQQARKASALRLLLQAGFSPPPMVGNMYLVAASQAAAAGTAAAAATEALLS